MIGRIFWEGAVGAPASDIGELEPVLDEPAAARLPHPRAPLLDLGRAGLPLQARPHPRRRLLRARQGRPCRAPPAGDGVAVRDGGRRARRDPRLPPRPGGDAARGARRLASRRSSRREPPRRSRRPAGARSPARRTAPRGGCSCARSRSSRRCSGASSPRAPRGGSPTSRRRRRDGARLRGRDRGRRQAAPGPRSDRARRERAPARSRPAARARARRAGSCPARGREAGGPVRGAHRRVRRSAGGWAISTTTSAGSARRSRSRGEIGRKDLEANAVRRARELRDRASRSRSRRRGSSPRRWSSPRRAATSPRSAGRSSRRLGIDALRGRLDEATAGLARAEELFSQSGNAWALARVSNHYGWVERAPRRPRRRRPPLPRRDPDPEAARGPRHPLREPARPRRRCSSAAGRSTRPSATRSRRARPSARTTRSRARRRAWRSGSSAPRRDATRRREALLREAVEIVARQGADLIRREVLAGAGRIPARPRPRRRGRGVPRPRSRPTRRARTRAACRAPRGSPASTASSGDSLITVAGRSKRASASRSGSARSVPSP